MDTKDLNKSTIPEWRTNQPKPTRQRKLWQAVWNAVAFLRSLTFAPHLCGLSPCGGY